MLVGEDTKEEGTSARITTTTTITNNNKNNHHRSKILPKGAEPPLVAEAAAPSKFGFVKCGFKSWICMHHCYYPYDYHFVVAAAVVAGSGVGVAVAVGCCRGCC